MEREQMPLLDASAVDADEELATSSCITEDICCYLPKGGCQNSSLTLSDNLEVTRILRLLWFSKWSVRQHECATQTRPLGFDDLGLSGI